MAQVNYYSLYPKPMDINTLHQASIGMLQRNKLYAFKASRKVYPFLEYSQTFLFDGTILRHFHARDKQGFCIQQDVDGIPSNTNQDKIFKRLFNTQGQTTHILTKVSKVSLILLYRQLEQDFSNAPDIAVPRYYAWLNSYGQIQEGFINEYKPPDFVDFFNESKLRFSDILNIFMKIANAIKHMHDKHWVHLDIKPQNILVNRHADHFDILLIDFDYAIKLQTLTQINPRGSRKYMAPEMWKTETRTQETCKKADIYSFGASMLEVLKCVTGNHIKCPIKREFHKLASTMIESRQELRPTINQVIVKLGEIIDLAKSSN